MLLVHEVAADEGARRDKKRARKARKAIVGHGLARLGKRRRWLTMCSLVLKPKWGIRARGEIGTTSTVRSRTWVSLCNPAAVTAR